MRKPASFCVAAVVAAVSIFSSSAEAEIRMPALFSDGAVLQRNQPVKVWGWTDAGQSVSVNIAGQTVSGKADAAGRWEVTLQPLAVSPHSLRMVVRNGKGEQHVVTDVLVGEVWVCSGQSNMQWAVNSANDADLEKASANYPELRLITVPQVGTQEDQSDFDGQWEPATPETVGDFSAVGYFFGRQLHQTLDVPVGLIDNSWGGSAAEAWVKRSVLEADPKYKSYIDQWVQIEKTFDYEKLMADYKTKYAAWVAKRDAAAKAKQPFKDPQPRAPRNQLTGNARPGNLYSGVLHPIIGYGIRGAIWYQGESNASRAWNYRDLFPLMIQHWRDEWKQGDFPFYWVQLADFRDEVSEPGDSDWAELREAQTQTQDRLKNTGEAVIIDIGEGRDIHPRDKQNVAKRLARLALANDYGYSIPSRSPRFDSMKVDGNKAVVTLKHAETGLRAFDTAEVVGFAVAGADNKFVNAKAEIVGKNQVAVWADSVKAPVSVRYAWAVNPIANLYSVAGLPVTPFRSDNLPAITDTAAAEKAAAVAAAAEARKKADAANAAKAEMAKKQAAAATAAAKAAQEAMEKAEAAKKAAEAAKAAMEKEKAAK